MDLKSNLFEHSIKQCGWTSNYKIVLLSKNVKSMFSKNSLFIPSFVMDLKLTTALNTSTYIKSPSPDPTPNITLPYFFCNCSSFVMSIYCVLSKLETFLDCARHLFYKFFIVVTFYILIVGFPGTKYNINKLLIKYF